jgi:hypothetical protein
MYRGMMRLATKADILRPVIAFLVCIGLWGLVPELVQSLQGKPVLPVSLGVIFLLVTLMTARSLYERTRKLLSGRCPNPLCHGTVQHSEHVPRGYLVCPTCTHRWPEIEGIHYRLSGRGHA